MLDKITALINKIRFVLLNFVLPLILTVGAAIWRGASVWTAAIVGITSIVCLLEYYKTYRH